MTIITRFWEKVMLGPGCWEWAGAHDAAGYGVFVVDGRMRKAHRIAWTLSVGPIPEGLKACHHCDNRQCVRPDHLFIGTQLDNIADMKRKGRARGRTLYGEANPVSRYTDLQVLDVRRRRLAGEGNNAIARSTGISPMQVSRICRGIAWPHLKEVVQ